MTRLEITLLASCLLATACGDDGTTVDAASPDAAVDGAAVDVYTPTGDGALKPCTTPGSSCVTDDPCVVEAVCGQDKLCRPKKSKDCADQLSCTTDSCNAQGQCQSKPIAGSCVLQVKDSSGKVELKCFKQDDPNPQNACEICAPSTSATTWSNAAGVACDDGQDCTKDDTCTGGKCVGTDYSASCPAGAICLQPGCDGKGGCTSPKVVAGYCWIDNNCWSDGATSKDGCGSCDAKTSQTSWTSPAALCKIGPLCYQKAAKHPGGCAQCNPAASTSSWTVTSGCLINDQCYTSGAKDASGCSACNPTTSATSWTPLTGLCQIMGSCYTKGQTHSGLCAVCDPALSSTSWTVVGNRCLINDQCYKEDDTDVTGCQICAPATSKTSWSPTPSTCNIAGKCYQKGAKGTQFCEVCDPAQTASGWSPAASTCLISGQCYTSGAMSSNGCGECKPATDATGWTAITNTCLIDGKCHKDGDVHPQGCAKCDAATSSASWTITNSAYCVAGGNCVAKATSTLACGACGVACGAGETCGGGKCTCGTLSGTVGGGAICGATQSCYSSACVNLPPGTLIAPLSLSFETSNGGLTGTKDWEWGQLGTWTGTNCDSAAIPPKAAHSGSGMWATKLNQCYTPLNNAASSCSNASTTDDSILSFKVIIPGSWTKATLSFWEWYDLYLYWDWSEIRVDGVVVAQTCTGTKPSPQAWKQRTVDLSSYVGKTVTVAFHMMATSVVNHAGWYIDDLALSGS